MRTLTIEAASLASARGFYEALSGFRVELEEAPNGTFFVRVAITGTREIVPVLQALERHATTRPGITRIDIDGEGYAMEGPDTPTPPP